MSTTISGVQVCGKPPESGGWWWLPDCAVGLVAIIGPLAWSVYTVLRQHADGDGVCWPSATRIARIPEHRTRR